MPSHVPPPLTPHPTPPHPKGADEFRPDLGYFEHFFTAFASPGLDQDSDASSHPLSRGEPMTKLDDIDNQFDDISYSKVGFLAAGA
jgi:aminopeptidase N